MKGKPITILSIGKLKAEYWRTAFSHYRKMLEKWRSLRLIELKDSPAGLSVQKRIEQEGERLLAALPPNTIAIALSENGKEYSSCELAQLLKNWRNQTSREICFIIGGPFGLHESVVRHCDQDLSLSKMTWPHELARILLLEQLYRAHAILANSAYHY